ncbi:MAG: hypothetical protein AAB426_10735, partial [Myxococcota bacterium]
ALSGMLMLPVAATSHLSFLATLGRHSLFAYMASVELTFGMLSKIWHHRLSMPATLFGMLAMVLITLVLIRSKDWIAARRRAKAQPERWQPTGARAT